MNGSVNNVPGQYTWWTVTVHSTGATMAKEEVEQLADRIRPLLADQEAVVERRMFGGIAFLINGNMSVAASGHGGLMLRCEPSQSERLVAEPGVDRMVMRGRAMDGWLRVEPRVVAGDDGLQRWVHVGVEYARSLPVKD